MKKTFLILFAAALSFSSCTDYLDVNESSNNPHTVDIDPTALLGSALSTPFRTQAGTMNEFGNVMTNGWASNVNSWTGGYSTEFTMNFTTNTRADIWDNLYLGLNNLDNIINFPNDKHVYDNYVAIAKIMKSHYMGYIIDLYGNAPYSEAFKGAKKLRPAYDDDKVIYKDLLAQLDQARKLINDHLGEAPNAQDIVFAGNMTKWTALANTIELRLLLRLSDVTDAEFVAIRDARIKNLSGAPFISSDAIINPGYSGAAGAQNNPFYNIWGRNEDGSSGGTRATFSCASGYLGSVLNGTQINGHINSSGVVDPRRGRIFGLRNSIVAGVTQGDVTVIAGGTAPNPVSFLGVGLTGYIGGNASERYQNGATKNGYLLLASESFFLQAEAAFRYSGIFAGDAQTLFQNGIKASFTHYNEPLKTVTFTPITPDAYILASDSKLGLGWTATPNKLEAIMTQKWIALVGINGIETFIDHTRTGFPSNPLALTATKANRPNRLLYPQSEYTANSANVPNVTLDKIFVKNEFTPFWVK
jgi:hypothetical protein